MPLSLLCRRNVISAGLLVYSKRQCHCHQGPQQHLHLLSSKNMSSAAPLLGRILANSVSLANKSAQIARDIMASGELGVTEKTGIDDLQTKADR